MANVNDIVSVQPGPKEAEIFVGFYMQATKMPGAEENPWINSIKVSIEKCTLSPDKVGDYCAIWHAVLDTLNQIPLQPKYEGDFFSVLNHFGEVLLNTSLRGRPNFLIVNKNGLDNLNAVLHDPYQPDINPEGWSHDEPSVIGEIDSLAVYYDETIPDQILGYRGITEIDSGIIVGTFEDKYGVKMPNSTFYLRFNF